MNEDELRRVLDAEAMSVEVSPDALAVVRRRIADRRTRWLPRGGSMFAISTGGLAAAATVVAVFAGVGSCAPPDATPPPGATSSPEVSPPVETGPSPTAGPTAGPGTVNARLAVYYVGQDRNRPRLYREFQTHPAGDGSVVAKTRAAITAMLGHRAADPDYSSPWPTSARVRDVRIAGGTVTVDLSGAGQNSVGSEAAHVAVQQLVWTATANSSAGAVRLLLDGRQVGELWGHVGISGDLRRAPAIDTLAAVWLISPQHGDVLGRTFEVHVDGTVFEATVQIRVLQNGRTVNEKFVTVSGGAPARGEGRLSLTLSPGTYVIEAYESSAEDGSVLHPDNHQVTVR